MIRKTTLILLIAMAALASMQFDCGPSYPPPTPGGGFSVETSDNGKPQEWVGVNGRWDNDKLGAQGSVFNFEKTTNGLGHYFVNGGRAPAGWYFRETTGPCVLSNSLYLIVEPFGTAVLNCVHATIGSAGSFFFSPSPLYTDSPPPTCTITGQGMSAQYGMPLLQYFDSSGTLVAQTTATAVAPDGTSLQANTPDISSLQSGVYVGQIKNATSGGGWQLIGVGTVQVAAPAPPPPPCIGCAPL